MHVECVHVESCSACPIHVHVCMHVGLLHEECVHVQSVNEE